MAFSFSTIRQSKTVHTIAIFTTGNMVAMVLGVVGSLVQARYVAPEDMGVFRTFSIVIGYLTFLHLGVFDGLHRELPLQFGRENRKKAEDVAAASLAWIAFISLVSVAFFLGLAVKAAFCREWMQFWGWLAFLPFVAMTFYGGYLGATFRTSQQFIAYSNANVVQSAVGTLLLPLMPFLGYYGACLRTAAGSATNLFLLHRWRPLKLRPRLDWRNFWEVIRIGLPLSGIGYVYTSLWTSLEGTMMLEWYGIKVLGLYAVAMFVRNVVVQLALNMNQVMGVKIYEQYGRTGRVADCMRLIFKPMMWAFLASLPLITVGWVAMPWAVSLLLPKYVGAVSMGQVMLAMLPITFLSLPITVLWATGRQFYCFLGVIVGFLSFVGFAYVFRQLDLGVLSVPVASMLGQAINVCASYLLILKLYRDERRIPAAEESLCCDANV